MLDFYTARLRHLVVDDRFDAVLFRAPHPLHRDDSDWQPFIWREPIVGWVEVRCSGDPEDAGCGLVRSTTEHFMSGAIIGEGGELRPLVDCDDILDQCLLFVLRRGEQLDEAGARDAAVAAMKMRDPSLLALAQAARETRGELS